MCSTPLMIFFTTTEAPLHFFSGKSPTLNVLSFFSRWRKVAKSPFAKNAGPQLFVLLELLLGRHFSQLFSRFLVEFELLSQLFVQLLELLSQLMVEL